jgi:prophage tail gpP-like protein
MILKVDNKNVDFFTEFNLDLRYDAIASTFSFTGYFNPENPLHKEIYKPGKYQVVTLEHEGELILTGRIISTVQKSSSVKELVSFGGYSLPGVLEDCEIPTSLYPLQSDGRTLRQITERLIKPFGLKLISNNLGNQSLTVDKKIEKSTAIESQSIRAYINTIAAQLYVHLTHDEFGNLIFTRAKTDSTPVIDFNGNIPETSMELSFSGQQMHSDITVVKQASLDGGNAGESTVKNPYVKIFRPTVKVQTSGTDFDTSKAARQILSAELKNLKLTITIDRWDYNKKLIKPNSIVSVINPDLYIYKKTNFFIEGVSYKGNSESMTAVLTCVIPEVYSGKTPINIFD